jgi:hypothetical protein
MVLVAAIAMTGATCTDLEFWGGQVASISR